MDNWKTIFTALLLISCWVGSGSGQSVGSYESIVKNVYRDYETFPIDPRKPCHLCIQRQQDCGHDCRCGSSLYGFQGRPHQDTEPGGCLCAKKKQQNKHPNINVYWPSMFAGVREEYFSDKSARLEAADRPRLVDINNRLAGFRLVPYQRRDNGHCGPNRDRYGCVGESRYLPSAVFGVVPRSPGDPHPR